MVKMKQFRGQAGIALPCKWLPTPVVRVPGQTSCAKRVSYCPVVDLEFYVCFQQQELPPMSCFNLDLSDKGPSAEEVRRMTIYCVYLHNVYAFSKAQGLVSNLLLSDPASAQPGGATEGTQGLRQETAANVSRRPGEQRSNTTVSVSM